MPVTKYRNVADMERHGWMESGDPRLATVIRQVWEFAARIAPARPPRGVRKYQSMAALNADEARWRGNRGGGTGVRTKH